MILTLKDATVKRYHYDNHDQLRRHLTDFVAAYNFGRRLKTLKGLTPHKAICQYWTKEPHPFISDLTHQTSGTKHLMPPYALVVEAARAGRRAGRRCAGRS